jgi:hypothetical protein
MTFLVGATLATILASGAVIYAVDQIKSTSFAAANMGASGINRHLQATSHQNVEVTGVDADGIHSPHLYVTSKGNDRLKWVDFRRSLDTLYEVAAKTVESQVMTLRFESSQFSATVITGEDKEVATERLKHVYDYLDLSFDEIDGLPVRKYDLRIDLTDERPKVTLQTYESRWKIVPESYDLSNEAMINLLFFVEFEFEEDSGIDWTVVSSLRSEDKPLTSITVSFNVYDELLEQSKVARETIVSINEFVMLNFKGTPTSINYKADADPSKAVLQVIYSEEDETPASEIEQQLREFWDSSPRSERSHPFNVFANYGSVNGDSILSIRR